MNNRIRADIEKVFLKTVGTNEKLVKLTIESTVIDQDYLEFLKIQIKLKARGDDWNEVLNKRLTAFGPWVNQQIFSVIGYSTSCRYSAYISTDYEMIIFESIECAFCED